MAAASNGTSAKVRRIPLDEITPHPRNPKDHDLDRLVTSIARFGFVEPVVVDQRTGLNVSGHGRVEALGRLRDLVNAGETDPRTGQPYEIPPGITARWEVPVYVGWASSDDAEADAALVALNRIGEVGGWDTGALVSLLDDLDAADRLAGVGYAEDDLAALHRQLDAMAAEPVDPAQAWDDAGMPEFDQPDLNPAAKVTVYFPTDADADSFFAKLGRDRASRLWWPQSDGHVGCDINAEWVAPTEGDSSRLGTVLSTAPKDGVRELGALLRDASVDEAGPITELAAAMPKWRRGKGDTAPHLDRYQAVEDRWYASLDAGGEPDWTVYDDPWYLPDLWGCWIVYSRYYLRSIENRVPGGVSGLTGDTVGTVADLGCGLGFTTAAITELVPDATVYGTNLPGLQWDLAARMAKRHGFELTEAPEPADVVFASEYFEHFLDPVTHVREIIEACQPRVLIAANAFCTTSVGHFRTHTVDGRSLDGKATGKAFRDALSSLGYERLDLGLWDNRPEVFRRG